jgi:hypothetical protein
VIGVFGEVLADLGADVVVGESEHATARLWRSDMSAYSAHTTSLDQVIRSCLGLLRGGSQRSRVFQGVAAR